MINPKRMSRLFAGLPLVFACTLFIAPAQAQEDGAEEGVLEEITVTGSRIRRDEYSSPSPIQVLDVQAGRQLGISSISELLQRTTVANGNQIDSSLNTNAGNSNASEAPPTGGVGSSNIDLRGLGPERTLVLVNGRRLGSTGVRGAPAQPDINLIPFSMVQRVEVLTEGVSAVYGADAVAGVVNVILRDEFEGLEITVNGEVPKDDGGEIVQLSMIAGAQSDRASITFGAELFDRSRVKTGDRSASASYQRMYQTANGVVQVDYDGFFDNVFVSLDNLDVDPLGDRSEVFMFYTPGVSAADSSIGIENYGSFLELPGQNCVPPSGFHDFAEVDGQRGSSNFPYCDFYNDQDERRAADLVGEMQRNSAVTLGKINMDWWSNEEIFFEAYYLNTQVFSRAATEQIFPDVPGMIPQTDINGNILVTLTDTAWAEDQEDDNEFLDDDMTPNPQFGMCDPNAADGFGAGENVPGSAFPCAGVLEAAAGVPILVDNPFNPLVGDMAPILTLDSLPQTRDVEKTQYRFVTGIRGDLGDSSWSYEGYFSYDRGVGHQSQPILFENNLVLSTLTLVADVNGNVTCGTPNNTTQLGAFDTQAECVPIDWTNPNIYTGGATGEGTFSDAETAFLIGNRTNRTVVEQTIWSFYATGDLFEMGGSTVAAAIGAEFREDDIVSQNSLVGVFGVNAAENPLQEGETIGSRDVADVFAEISIPLLENLDFDAAVRFTDESNFGNETTWRARIAWAPADWVTFSGSAGTSFRAPNLREQFLAGQGGGIGGTADPCLNRNIQIANGTVNAAAFANLVSNCEASGIQFIDADGDGQNDTNILGTLGVTTIPTSAGGNVELTPETSDSYTATIKFSVPGNHDYDFDAAISYWSIEIENSVNEPNANFIINRCYASEDGNLGDGFCDLVTRPGGANQASNIINFVDISFINIGEETAKGIDLNTRLVIPFDGLGLDLSWATATTYQLENEIEIFTPEDRDDNVGEIGTPELKFTSTLSLSKGDWELLMQNRFIDDGQYDNSLAPAPILLLENIVGTPVDFVDSVWYTDLSLTYFSDAWTATIGVNNLMDEDPPRIDVNGARNIDNNGANQRNNAVTSTGYDLFGRTLFATFSVGF